MLRLQKKGEIAFNGHKDFHAKSYSEIVDGVDNITPEQILFFQNILNRIDKGLSNYM